MLSKMVIGHYLGEQVDRTSRMKFHIPVIHFFVDFPAGIEKKYEFLSRRLMCHIVLFGLENTEVELWGEKLGGRNIFC